MLSRRDATTLDALVASSGLADRGSTWGTEHTESGTPYVALTVPHRLGSFGADTLLLTGEPGEYCAADPNTGRWWEAHSPTAALAKALLALGFDMTGHTVFTT